MTGTAEKRGGAQGSRWTLLVWGGAGALLLVPLAAMRVTGEVDWSPLDFTVMGALLLAVCGIIELAVRASTNAAYRAGVAVAVATAFVIVWLTLAVGIIGGDDPVNLLFGAVLAVGLGGAATARFESAGMARAMVVTAVAQAGVGIAAVLHRSLEGLVLIIGFTALWLFCAWLFQQAAKRS